MGSTRSYPGDVPDDERALVAPCLSLLREDAPRRRHPLRALFNALRHLGHPGCRWRCLPNDLPPWAAVCPQRTRWRNARAFDAWGTL